MTTTRKSDKKLRYQQILLAFYRHLTDEPGISPAMAVDKIQRLLSEPSDEPSDREAIWLNALTRHLRLDLGLPRHVEPLPGQTSFLENVGQTLAEPPAREPNPARESVQEEQEAFGLSQGGNGSSAKDPPQPTPRARSKVSS